MPKSGKKARVRSSQRARHIETKQAGLLDDLSQFEEFKESILPAMQADIKSGLSAEALRTKYHALIQASLITTALVEKDAGKRTAAGKDLLDRIEGKAKERIDHTHKLEKLPDEELNSVLASELKNLVADEDELLN